MKRILGGIIVAMFSVGASAQQAGVVSRYPAGTIQSMKMADAALADVSKERSEIEKRYIAEEQACHPQFFATKCIEEAKEHRRHSLMQLRPIEIEAHTFKRQSRVTGRDKALAAKHEQDAEKLIRRQHEEVAAESESLNAQEESVPESPRKVQARIFEDRSAKHEAKLNQIKSGDAASAPKRAEKVAAYQKKVAETQAHQKQIESRKAEKEQKRKAKLPPEQKPQ